MHTMTNIGSEKQREYGFDRRRTVAICEPKREVVTASAADGTVRTVKAVGSAQAAASERARSSSFKPGANRYGWVMDLDDDSQRWWMRRQRKTVISAAVADRCRRPGDGRARRVPCPPSKCANNLYTPTVSAYRTRRNIAGACVPAGRIRKRCFDCPVAPDKHTHAFQRRPYLRRLRRVTRRPDLTVSHYQWL